MHQQQTERLCETGESPNRSDTMTVLLTDWLDTFTHSETQRPVCLSWNNVRDTDWVTDGPAQHLTPVTAAQRVCAFVCIWPFISGIFPPFTPVMSLWHTHLTHDVKCFKLEVSEVSCWCVRKAFALSLSIFFHIYIYIYNFCILTQAHAVYILQHKPQE